MKSDGDFNIVVLDGETVVHGGLNWDDFKSLGNLTVYPLTPPAEVESRIEQAHAVITNKVRFGTDLIRKLTRVKYIGVTATGYNIIDVEAAREHGVAVTNVPAYSTDSVAQQVFAHLLNHYVKVDHYASLVKRGAWSKSSQFCLLDQPTFELAGKTLGIIGYGDIGRKVHQIAEAFGMKVLVADREGQNTSSRTALAELLQRSDIVTLHCPQTSQTHGMVNKQFLEQMKDGAILVNTARGGIVVEAELAEALTRGKISFAALDVLITEPPKSDQPLIAHPATQITPHVAWSTVEARSRLLREGAENLKAFQQGIRRNRVD